MFGPQILLTASQIEEFTPPSLVGRPNCTIFMLGVPTPAERDGIDARLVNLGLIGITMESARATMIDELYKLHEEAKADEIASFLDSFWQREDAQRTATGEAGHPAQIGPQALPISVREKSRAKLLMDEVTQTSQRFRELLSWQLTFPQRTALMKTRLVVKGAVPGSGAITPFPFDLEADHEKLTEASCEKIRAFIGEQPWRELVLRVEHLFLSPQSSPANFTGAGRTADGIPNISESSSSRSSATSLH